MGSGNKDLSNIIPFFLPSRLLQRFITSNHSTPLSFKKVCNCVLCFIGATAEIFVPGKLDIQPIYLLRASRPAWGPSSILLPDEGIWVVLKSWAFSVMALLRASSLDMSTIGCSLFSQVLDNEWSYFSLYCLF